MQWYVLLRRVPLSDQLRQLKKLSRFKRMNENTWSFMAQDVDYQANSDGFVQTFRREDVARRYYKNTKGIDGQNSSVYLIYAEAFTRKGAAKKALGCILSDWYQQGEIIDLYQHGHGYGRVQ